MRLPTQGEQIGIRQLLERLTRHTPAANLSFAEREACSWLDDALRVIDKELSDLRAAPNLTAPEYAAHYTMGRAPYAQGERGADY